MSICWYLYSSEKEDLQKMKEELRLFKKTKKNLKEDSYTYNYDRNILNDLIYTQTMEIKLLRIKGRKRFFKAWKIILHMKVKPDVEEEE